MTGWFARDKLGRLGIFGRKLFPDHRIMAQSLVLQLNFRAARERLSHNVTPSTPKAECEKMLCDYFDAYLAWDTAHGWHSLWGWNAWEMGLPPGVAEKLAKSLGDKSAVNVCCDHVSQMLSAKYDKTAAEFGCIAPLKKAILAAVPTIASLAQKAKATASVTPNPAQYPASNANDGRLGTLYWPGA